MAHGQTPSLQMSAPDSWQLCPKCGHWLPGDAFTTRGCDASRPRLVCIPCIDDQNDARKRADRWRIKARSTRRSHAKKIGLPTEILERDYGWVLDVMARDMEHAWQGHCACGFEYMRSTSGYGEMSVDIIDRDAPPVWGHNTRLICQTCNRRKGIASVAKRSAIELAYRIRLHGEPAAPPLFS
jgi:hypothetical protein